MPDEDENEDPASQLRCVVQKLCSNLRFILDWLQSLALALAPFPSERAAAAREEALTCQVALRQRLWIALCGNAQLNQPYTFAQLKMRRQRVVVL